MAASTTGRLLRAGVGAAMALAVSMTAACSHAGSVPVPRGTGETPRSAIPSVAPSLTRPSPSGPSARAESVDHGPRKAKQVALTFDADMTPSMIGQLKSGQVSSWYNRAVIKELRSTRTPATIFLTGLWTKTYPAAVKSFASDPLFELANHSWDHSAFAPNCYGLTSVSTRAEKKAEIAKAAAEIKRVAGIEPFFFRFPGGCHSQADLKLVADQGEQVVGWDVVSGDAFQPDPAPIVQAVVDRVKPGSIIVMHLHGGPNAPATDEALKQIIPALKNRGYEFVTLSTLLYP